MTYTEIVAKLQHLGLTGTSRALDAAVQEEARALSAVRGRSSETGIRRAVPAAEQFYADDITAKLADPSVTPDEVLGLRRAATAWAVAERIRLVGVAEVKS
jgi:hypothetical protein